MKKKSVLILEDENQLRTALSHFLRAEGYVVTETSEIAECREKILSTDPDMIIMDVILPDGDSNDLLIEILSHEKYQKKPVIVISGIKISTDDKKLAYNSGAVHFMTKPIKLDEIIDRIELIFRVIELENKHMALENQYNHIFKYSNDPIITLNQGGQILSCNNAFEHMVSNTETQILNMNFLDFLNDIGINEWNQRIDYLNSHEKIAPVKLELKDYFMNTCKVDTFISKSSRNSNWETVYLLFFNELS